MKFTSILTATTAAFALFAGPPAMAQDTGEAGAEIAEEATVPAEPAADAPALPAMWKVADEDTTIYLFGTVHLLPDDVNWHSGAVKQALSSSGELVTEIDMTPEALATISAAMNARGTLPEGETLRDLMNAEQRATFEAGIGKLGIPAGTFDRLEPWLASFAILQIALQSAGYSDDNGVEKVLEATVSPSTGRVALEAVDFQIAVFDELPVEQQMLFLLEGAEDPIASIGALGRMVDLWSAGRAEDLGALMNEALMAHPNLAERLLYSRNANWAEWIDTRLDNPGTVFMAVGAGHLAGDRSVQDILATRGIASLRVQ